MILPIFQKNIIDTAIMKRNERYLFLLVTISIILTSLNSILIYLQSKIQIKINNDFSKDLQLSVMARLLRLNKSIISKKGILNIYKNIDYCVESLSLICSQTLLRLFIEVFKFIGISIAIFYINWKLALICFIFIPIKSVTTKYYSRKSEEYTRKNIEIHKKLHQLEDDIFNNIIEIKLNNLYEIISLKHENILNKINKTIKELELFGIKDSQIGDILANIIYYILFLISSYLIWDNSLTVGGLLVIATYFSQLLNPVALIASFKMLYSKIVPIIDEYEEFFSLSIENNTGKAQFTSYHPTIELNTVSYAYDKAHVLKNVSFEIDYGKKVAIVGDNGSGKSTLIDLILRFIEPNSGKIFIDGKNILDIPIDSYREYYSVLPQNNNLFNDSILNNITLFSKYKLDDTLLNSKLFSFNETLLNSYETRVGSRSSMVSGGERQKILLARMILKDSPILVLDEPTANYDLESIKNFTEFIKCIDKSMLIITHEPEIIKVVDKILYVSNQNVFELTNYSEYIDFKNNDIIEKKSKERGV